VTQTQVQGTSLQAGDKVKMTAGVYTLIETVKSVLYFGRPGVQWLIIDQNAPNPSPRVETFFQKETYTVCREVR
jgi:hypothetical protein